MLKKIFELKPDFVRPQRCAHKTEFEFLRKILIVNEFTRKTGFQTPELSLPFSQIQSPTNKNIFIVRHFLPAMLKEILKTKNAIRPTQTKIST